MLLINRKNIIKIKIFYTSCSFSILMNKTRLPPRNFPRSHAVGNAYCEKSRTKNRSQALLNIYYSELAIESIYNYVNLLQMYPILLRLIIKMFKY
jgi:hypothetical protein